MKHLIAVAAALASAVPALAQPANTNADWIQHPTPEQTMWVYPPRAADQGINGNAILVCTVNTAGLAVNCQVVEETPQNYGFGDAAIALSREFRFRPATRGGQPAPSQVRVPIVFAVPPEPSATPEGPPPEAARMAAARRLVAAVGFEQVWARQSNDWIAFINGRVHRTGRSAVEERRTAYAAAQEVMRLYHPRFAEAVAADFARQMSVEEMEQALTFYRTPAGQRVASIMAASNPQLAALQSELIEALRDRICGADRDCRVGWTPPAQDDSRG
jgi:TonB family protein